MAELLGMGGPSAGESYLIEQASKRATQIQAKRTFDVLCCEPPYWVSHELVAMPVYSIIERSFRLLAVDLARERIGMLPQVRLAYARSIESSGTDFRVTAYEKTNPKARRRSEVVLYVGIDELEWRRWEPRWEG